MHNLARASLLTMRVEHRKLTVRRNAKLILRNGPATRQGTDRAEQTIEPEGVVSSPRRRPGRRSEYTYQFDIGELPGQPGCVATAADEQHRQGRIVCECAR